MLKISIILSLKITYPSSPNLFISSIKALNTFKNLSKTSSPSLCIFNIIGNIKSTVSSRPICLI